VKLLFKKNYLTQIENSTKGENHLFRNFYVEKDPEVEISNASGKDKSKSHYGAGGEIVDSLENGRNSCAVLVSSILYSFNSLLEFSDKKLWIKFIHTTVISTEKDMLENGWYEIKELKSGAVIIWEKKDGCNGEPHNHIGFFMGGEEAISNDSRGTGFPHKHHYTYNGTRKIEKIYSHDELN